MNIKFIPKLSKISTPAALASAVGITSLFSLPKNQNDIEIKDLNDIEFEQLKNEIAVKKRNLNKQNLAIFNQIQINKYNIQCLSKLMDDNNSFYRLYTTLLGIDGINSAKMLAFELNNRAEIDKNIGKSFILTDIHRKIITPEELEFKKKLIEYGLHNTRVAQNIYFAEIVKRAKNMEDAIQMIEHTEKFGIMPDARTQFYDKYGKDIADKMLDGVADIKTKFNADVRFLSSYANSYHELYNILKGGMQGHDTIFRFDTKTGEIVTFEHKDCIYNFNNKTTTKIIPTSIKEDKAAFLDSRKLLGAGFEIRNFNGDLLATRKFRRSRFKGEFELEETTSNGKTYKLGLTEKDKKGGKHVEKHFTSFDGTITDYVYASDRKGNNYSYYKITDRENNVLYEAKKKFKVFSDTHFQSEVDGILYDIFIDKDKISIAKLDGSGDRVEYKIKKYSDNDYVRMENFLTFCDSDDSIKSQLNNKQTTAGELAVRNGIIEEKNTVDKRLLRIIKKISGEEWFAINNAKVYTIRAAKDKNIAHSIGNAIEIGSNNHFFAVLEHELGHEKARALDLENAPELKRIYEYEKNLFTTNLPNLAVEQAGYFLRDMMASPLGETIAESNLIVNGEQDWNNIGSRTLFLQQYFPRTIAYIANKYQELV